MLKVSDLHTLHFEQVGNPTGKCALFLHGGPGVGINPGYRRFFDPAHFRTILLDQRGAGRSTPHATLEQNDTWALVEDLEKLRRHLGVDEWVVMGGSWGSLLALCYAIHYPKRVTGLILRGVFLGRPDDMAWGYNGIGTAQLFPEQWSQFKALIEPAKDSETIPAYYKLMTSDNPQTALAAARRWEEWGASTVNLLPDARAIALVAHDETVLTSRIECHYALNNFFMPTPNYVLENIAAIRGIPCHIVHGRYDVICPASNAWKLHQVLPNSKLDIIDDGGHSPMETSMLTALVLAANAFIDR